MSGSPVENKALLRGLPSHSEAEAFCLGSIRPELKKGVSPDELDVAEGKIWFSVLKARRGQRAKWPMRFDGPTLRVQPDTYATT